MASLALGGTIRWSKIANSAFYWDFEGFLPGNRQKIIIFAKRTYLSAKDIIFCQKKRIIAKRYYLSLKEVFFRQKKRTFVKRYYLSPKELIFSKKFREIVRISEKSPKIPNFPGHGAGRAAKIAD
jgi:hypothetical protein